MNPKTSFALFYSMILLLIAGTVTPSLAQYDIPKVTSEAEPVSADSSLASPVDTFKTFLRAFPDEEEGRSDRIIPQATKTMDFPNKLIPDEQKRFSAIQLKGILDRIEFVDYEKINNEWKGDRYVFKHLKSGSIVLDSNDNNEWRFTEETVDSLQDMWEEVQDEAVVAGVTTYDQISIGEYIRGWVPESLRGEAVFLETWQWLGIFVFVVFGLIADRLMIFILIGVLTLGLKRTGVKLERAQKYKALRPLGLLAMATVWYIGVYSLLLPLNVVTVFSLAVRFVAALSFVWAAYKVVDAIAFFLEQKAKKTETKLDDLVVPFFRKVAKAFVIAFGLVFIAQQLRVDVTSLLAGLGLGGLAFALAAKDTLENVFGSLTVLVDHPFSVGDWIVIDGVCDGSVESVGLRSTRVRTFYNSLITVPNSILTKSAVDNYGLRQYRRWKTTLSLTYDSPPEKIEAFTEGLREVIKLHPYTRKDYYHVYANEFGPHSLDIMVYVFFETPDWATELRERHRLFLDILRLAQTVGVEFAFPTQTLHIARDIPQHEDKPKSTSQAMYKGRSAAHQILKNEFGSRVEKPAPVAIEIPDHLDIDEQERYLKERLGGGE